LAKQIKPVRPVYQHDFILIDRSGSMQGLWEDALGGVNSYVKKLAKDKVDTGVTVIFFDSEGWGGSAMSFDVARDRITPETFKQLTNEDATPRGGTPLSDAVGRLVTMAEAGGYDKVSIIIMTDGHENASTEYSVADAKKALDRCRQRDWVVQFLGANFQNDAQAASYGNHMGNTAFTTVANLNRSFEILGGKRGLYSSGAIGASADSMSWTAQEKAEVSKD
jgi:hypothetical protein